MYNQVAIYFNTYSISEEIMKKKDLYSCRNLFPSREGTRPGGFPVGDLPG